MRYLPCVAPAPTPALPRPRGREGPASAGGWGLAGSLLFHDLALLRLDRLLGDWIVPPSIQSNRVFGRDGGAPVFVPIGDAKGRDMIMRDHVVAVLQHAVEGARVSHEAPPIGRLDQ